MSLGFNIPLSANPDQLRKDLDESINIVKSASGKMAAGTETVTAAYKALDAQYNTALAKTSQLAKKYGETSVEALNAAKSAATLAAKLADTPKHVSEYGQAATRASSGFNAMNYSVMQLTREAPAFANSMQTGFMAISNNLPTLFDAVKGIRATNLELQAAGKPTQSVLSQLGGALFSWNTAISAGITLLTVYGPQLFELSKNLFSVAQEMPILIKFSTKHTEAIKQQTEAIIKRNEALGLSIGATRNNISEEQQNLNVQKDKLTAYQNVYNELKKNVDIRQKGLDVEEKYRGSDAFSQMVQSAQKELYLTSQQYEIDQENLKIYKQKVDAQRVFVSELEKQLRLEQTLTNLKKVPNPTQGTIESRAASGLGSASAAVNAKIQADLDSITKTSKLVKIPIDVITEFRNNWVDPLTQKIQAQLAAVSQTLQNAATQIGLGITNAIGEGLATGDFDFSDVMNILAQLANQLAAAFVAIGTAASLAPGAQGIAWGYFAAAAALGIAAGVIRGLSGNGGGGGGGNRQQPALQPQPIQPSFSTNNSFGGSGDMSITTRQYGNDFLLIVDGQGRIKKRR